MNREKDGKTFWEKLATFIVDKRNLFFFLYIAGFIFSIFSQGWVKVCDDLTAYLPAQTETRRGLTIMEEEFTTYGTARIMLSHVTYEAADEMASRISLLSRRLLSALSLTERWGMRSAYRQWKKSGSC